ncbi:MAG: xanthine phosphoribosyltransferase [Erysipelotrichaceae bacterium]
MELLKQRIIDDGIVISTEIVKVDSFLNQQLDVRLFEEIGKEIRKRLKDEKITKILTLESSGISIATIASRYFDYVPVVFAKKALPNTLNEQFYSSETKSFTKGNIYNAIVSKKYLSADDRILIIDDFMAHGEAALSLANLAKQANATVVAIVAVIEKYYQGGSTKLRNLGYKVETLASIDKIEDGKIYFR